MPIVADAAVAIRGDLTGLRRDVAQGGAEIESTLGGRLKNAFSPRNIAIAGAAIGGIAAGLAPLATNVDNAMDSIRASTGAVGDALTDLQADFKAVAGQVPDDIGTVAQVLADVNTRTGLTGEGLRNLTEQILDFSRATGTDAVQNVALLTRVFGDWGVEVEDQSTTLDMFLRASQQTGIGVDQLQAKLVQFGAPLRQMGFSLDEATVLLGKFEKEGVNSELVMGSLRIALGKMARDGEEAPETFARITEEIARLGPSAEATALGMELFGARAGPDMVAAIQEGRFEVGALFDAVANGGETVKSVTADTEDAADGFKGFLNTATIALGEFAAPLAGFSEVAGPMLYTLPLLVSGLGGFAGMIMGTVIPAIMAGGSALVGLILATGPIGLVIAGVAALALAFSTNFLGIRDIVMNVIGFLGDVFRNAIGVFGAYWDAIAGAISAAVGVIVGAIQGIAGVVSGVASGIAGFFDWLTGANNNAVAQAQATEAAYQQTAAAVRASGGIAGVSYGSRGYTAPSYVSGATSRIPRYADGAWEIPADQLAMLHRGEMVVPAQQAEAMRAGGMGDTINVYLLDKMEVRTPRDIGSALTLLNDSGHLGLRKRGA